MTFNPALQVAALPSAGQREQLNQGLACIVALLKTERKSSVLLQPSISGRVQ